MKRKLVKDPVTIVSQAYIVTTLSLYSNGKIISSKEVIPNCSNKQLNDIQRAVLSSDKFSDKETNFILEIINKYIIEDQKVQAERNILLNI